MKWLLRKAALTGLKVIKNLVQNKSEGVTLEIYDVIGADYFGDGLTSQSVSDALKASKGPIHVRLNSPGGAAFEGIGIYNLLRSSGRPVKVTVDGVAASAASVVAMAGDEIVMGKGTMMMIHPAMMFAAGDAADLREAADLLDKATVNMADIYADRTKQPKDTVVEMMNAETWMTPQEALDKGFASAISVEGDGVKAIADFDLSTFKNVPAALIENRSGVTKKVDGENLTADDFIYVGDPENTDTWHLPWRFSTEEKTVSHLRDALARFSQAGIPPTKKAAAYEKLVGLCKEHGIEVSSPEKPPTALAADDLYMIDIMRKRIQVQRNA